MFLVRFAACCIDRSMYHMMFNSSMLCHCIMYIYIDMSIMFFFFPFKTYRHFSFFIYRYVMYY